MITERAGKKPTTIHNTKRKQLLADLRHVFDAFNKEMKEEAEKMVLEGKLKKDYLLKADDVGGPMLLELRRKLVYSIRKGMLQRKDLETNVGILAALIWFGRCEKEKADRILEDWG